MASRVDIIAAVLRRPRLRRPVLAHELRERLVQGVGAGSTIVDWTATVPQLAEAIDDALLAGEEKDTPAGAPSTALPSDGHALIVRTVGVDLLGSCQCGRAIGRTPRARSMDGMTGLWERHVDSVSAQAWAEALTVLPTSGEVVSRG
jgi:hypothetical protein